MFQPCISDGFWAKLRSFSPNRLPNYWIRNLCWDHPRKWRGSGQYSSLAESWRQTTCSYEEDSTRNCFLMFFFSKRKKTMFVRIGHVFPRCYQDSFLDAFLQVRKKTVWISRKETWKLKQSCDAVSFSNNGFFVGKPSKSYQPSETRESCGTFWFQSLM